MLCAGQVYRSTLTVYDQDTQPSTAALAITKPDGTLVTPAPTVSAPVQSGRDYTYTYDYTLPAAGQFKFTWTTQGPGTGPPPDYVNVRDFISIIGLAEAKTHLNITGTGSDDELAGFLMAATEVIESKIGTCVRRAVTGEYIPGTFRHVILLPSGPVPAADSVTSITSTVTGGPSWAAADLIVSPMTGVVRPRDRCGFWAGPWTATYTAGRLVIPERIMQACKEQVRHMWDTQRGAAPPSVLQGEEIYAPGTGSAYTVPRRVLELLEPDMAPVIA